MDLDKNLEKQFADFQQVAKENKDVDVAALMINAIQRQDKNLVSSKSKKWAYLISIGFPPFGLLVALRYYLKDEADAQSVANICVVLTLVSIALVWGMSKMILSGSGVSMEKIQQIKPGDIKQFTQ